MQGMPAALDRLHARKASPHGKVIQDILGFWIQRCEFRILDTGFRNSCQFGTRIPDSKAQDSGILVNLELGFRIPKPRIPDSTSKDFRDLEPGLLYKWRPGGLPCHDTSYPRLKFPLIFSSSRGLR